MSSVSMKNVDPAFQSGVGQRPGIEIWRVEDFAPVLVPKDKYGKFYTGDSYIILKTTALKSGALRHDIHFWLGNATSQDESGTAAIKSVELDAALGGRAVQYRETQGSESDKFLTYFKPCIIPLEGGCASGFKPPQVDKIEPRLFVCKGRRVVRVKQVAFSRTSLNHDDVFILDTEAKIYQFNGVNSSIQERAKALEVVQYIKDNDHDGKCAIAIIEDGKMAAEADTGEFWGIFGGFAPIGRKGLAKDSEQENSGDEKLLCFVDGNFKETIAAPLHREFLETGKCYLLDAGHVLYVWTGRATSLDERKAASKAAEDYIVSASKPTTTRIIRVIEGFETLMFKSCFDAWTVGSEAAAVSEEGRGKVAALLKQQGIDVKGLLKGAAVKEDAPSLFESSGKLEVWLVTSNSTVPVASEDHGKFFSGDCYVIRYSSSQAETESIICCWLGKQSQEVERSSSLRQVEEMSASFKGRLVQARIVQGKEPPHFIALFPSLTILKGGHSSEYRQLVAESGSEDETYREDGLALFRVRGSKPYNRQAVQVEPISTSLNSSDCFILQTAKTYLIWFGSFTVLEEQQAAVQIATFLKPGSSPKSLKEGSEPETFWNALGGKKVYPSQREPIDADKDPRLSVYNDKAGSTSEFEEVFNFTQDDLLSDDIMILDTQNYVFVWIGQSVSLKEKQQAFAIGERYVRRTNRLDGLSEDTPIYKITEGNEPVFFTKHFDWNPANSAVHVDPFERRLAALQGRQVQVLDTTPRRRSSAAFNGKESNKSERDSLSPKSVQKSGGAALMDVMPKATIKFVQDQSKEEVPEAEVDEAQAAEEEVKKQTSGYYSYESLKVKSSGAPPPGIDVRHREKYLSPEDFQNVFGIGMEQFQTLPKWKQDQYKKKADLF